MAYEPRRPSLARYLGFTIAASAAVMIFTAPVAAGQYPGPAPAARTAAQDTAPATMEKTYPPCTASRTDECTQRQSRGEYRGHGRRPQMAHERCARHMSARERREHHCKAM